MAPKKNITNMRQATTELDEHETSVLHSRTTAPTYIEQRTIDAARYRALLNRIIKAAAFLTIVAFLLSLASVGLRKWTYGMEPNAIQTIAKATMYVLMAGALVYFVKLIAHSVSEFSHSR